jgi:hypothetical protein
MGKIQLAGSVRVNGCHFETFFSCIVYAFFLYLSQKRKLSTLHVWFKRPRGIALKRDDFRVTVSQPIFEWDA